MSLPYGGFTTILNPRQMLAFAPWQDVRFGSEADICAAISHVRFTPNSDRESRHAQTVMSALPPKADIYWRIWYLCRVSHPAPHPLNVVFISCSELTAHLGFLERDVDPISGGEDGNRRQEHWPSADPQRHAQCKDHEAQIHWIAGELVGTTSNQFSI